MEQQITKDIGLKRLIKKAIFTTAQNNLGWLLLKASFIRVADYAKWAHNLVVRHGPFKGMKYLDAKSYGSVLSPKLIGSYEREIQCIVEEACKQEYTEVVNIGCGEGYYAIGFAMRIPKAKIYAYDTDQEAVRFCQKMAKLNNVGQRVIVSSFCSSETIQSIPFRGKGLIISDCEGYEMSLFSEKIIPTLARHDLLIELHDFIDKNISSIIRKRFERTHEIVVIESIDDIKKAQTYHYEELKDYSLQVRKQLLGERRPSIMQWFYIKSRKN